MCVGNSSLLMLINWIKTKYESNLFGKTEIFKSLRPVFEYKITFRSCVLALWIHKGYCVVKKLFFEEIILIKKSNCQWKEIELLILAKCKFSRK